MDDPLSLATDVTDATLGARGLWLGTRTGAGGTTTLTESFFLAAAHGSMGNNRFSLILHVWLSERVILAAKKDII